MWACCYLVPHPGVLLLPQHDDRSLVGKPDTMAACFTGQFPVSAALLYIGRHATCGCSPFAAACLCASVLRYASFLMAQSASSNRLSSSTASQAWRWYSTTCVQHRFGNQLAIIGNHASMYKHKHQFVCNFVLLHRACGSIRQSGSPTCCTIQDAC